MNQCHRFGNLGFRQARKSDLVRARAETRPGFFLREPCFQPLPASGIAAAPALFEARWILIFAQPGVKGDCVIIPRMGIRFAILSIFGQMHLAYISARLVFRRKKAAGVTFLTVGPITFFSLGTLRARRFMPLRRRRNI